MTTKILSQSIITDTQKWRRDIHSEELHNLYTLPNNVTVIKSQKM